jgi:hypothetical protein
MLRIDPIQTPNTGSLGFSKTALNGILRPYASARTEPIEVAVPDRVCTCPEMPPAFITIETIAERREMMRKPPSRTFAQGKVR